MVLLLRQDPAISTRLAHLGLLYQDTGVYHDNTKLTTVLEIASSKTTLMASRNRDNVGYRSRRNTLFANRNMKFTYPTKALDTDVTSLSPTGCTISHSVLQLVEAGSPSDPAIEFTAIFYGNCRKKTPFRMQNNEAPRFYTAKRFPMEAMALLTPAVLGQPPHISGRPWMLTCLPSKSEHCFSRKSCLPFGHESVLHDRNFILRPTQYLPPFLGLVKFITF